ncbi:MAG: protein kinase [Planctomycetota bacterium]|nr:protein kinase [Planctomycetota bacterium]
MNEEQLFLEALDKSPAERTQFLEDVCENQPELKARVLELLTAFEKPDHILDRTLDDPGLRAFHDVARETDAESLPPGTVLRYFGDYAIRKELGHGGMGVVFIATQLSLNRPVALKMIRTGILARAGDLRRFQQEAEAVALLDHPGIVPVYEVGEHDGQRYFTMKLIDGGDLSSRLASFRNDPEGAARLVAQIADAVHHAHQRGILHRDLKPANILLDAAGHPHVSDFGLAKRIEADGEMTASGEILGSPAFMSPEQAAGRRGSITTATDVYGLGAILYAVLTGQAPFGGDSVIETLDAVRTRPPVALREVNPRVPRDLELVCLKCLEKNPADRYSSAATLANDLRRFMAGEPVSVRAAGVVERAAKWARRKPTLATAYTLGLLACLLGSLGGAAIWQWRVAEQARRHAVSNKNEAVKAANAARTAKDGEAQERAAAVLARINAERARGVAEVARAESEVARAEADDLREKIEYTEYGRTVEFALQEWRENHVAATLELLGKTKPELRGWEWYYVSQLCHSELLTLPEHTNEVRSAAFIPDGSRIVTGSMDGTAKIWNAKTGECLQTLRHVGGCESATFSQDGTRIVTTSADNTAKVWDVASGAEIHVLKGHSEYLTCAAFSPDDSRIVTASKDETAKVWDALTGTVVFTLEKHDGLVKSARFSPDGRSIVTASWDSTVRLWDGKTGAQIRLLPQSSSGNFASFRPDGTRIVTALSDGTAKVWDASTGADLRTLWGHSGDIYSVTFSPDGKRIVTAGKDTTAKVWNAATGALLRTLRGHTKSVDSAAFSPDGSRIVTASPDSTAKVWDATREAEFVSLECPTALYSASFSPDDSRIVAASGGVRVFDVATREVVLSRSNLDLDAICTSFSPDGSRIVIGGGGGKAGVLDATTGANCFFLEGHVDGIYSASYSLDSASIITASRDGTAKVWDATTGEEKLNLKGHEDEVTSASFSPDGARIVTGGNHGTVIVWDGVTGAQQMNLSGHYGPCSSVSFSPDGSSILTGSDRTARIWDAQTGELIRTLEGHTAPVRSASFSLDGLRIVTASDDNRAKVWDARTGAEVLTLIGHSDGVKSASFSHDGSRIMTASFDHTVKLWDAGPVHREPLAKKRPGKPVNAPAIATQRPQEAPPAKPAARTGRDFTDALDFPAKRARLLSKSSDASLAKTARAKARTLLEAKLAEEPQNSDLAAGLAEVLLTDIESGTTWSPLQPARLKTERGSAVTAQQDGSILVDGTAEETLRIETALGAVAALRVQTSLPAAADNRRTTSDGFAIYNDEYQIVSAKLAASKSQGLHGQFVRIDLPGENTRYPRHPDYGNTKTLVLPEVQVFQGDKNIAEGQTARQSSTFIPTETDATKAVDGNMISGAHTSTVDETVPTWWELDFGSEMEFDRIVIWSQDNGDMYQRMNHFRVRVLDASRNVVVEQFIEKAPNPSREIRRPPLWVESALPAPGANGQVELRLQLAADPAGHEPFRLSVSSDPVDPTLEERREYVRALTDTWQRLAAAYDLIGDRAALDKLLENHPAAAAGISEP